MALKTYALRLDEEVYEGLKKALEKHGDPDLSISFILRKYLRDLHEALPNLEKSDFGLMNNLAFWGMMLRQVDRTAQIENILKGAPIKERIKAEIDDPEEFQRMKKKKK